jgi:hypothetical protein
MAMDIPMFHFDVRPVPQPYQSPYVQSMAQLIGAGDRYQAEAIQQSAAARAKGVEAIGSNVGGTLMDYAKYELAQRSPVVQLQKLKVQKEMEDMADDDLIQKTVASNGGDVEKALGALRQSGNVSVSAISKLQKMADESRNAALKSQHDTLNYQSDVLKQMNQMVPDAPDKPDDVDQMTAYRESYRRARPNITALVGQKFSAGLPDPDDPDLLNKLNEVKKWGTTATQATQIQRVGIAKAELALNEKRDQAKADEHNTSATGLFLTTAQNQGDWDKYLADAKARGASDAVLAQFPKEFSPQALNVARVLAQGKPDEPPKAGTLEDTIQRWAKEHGTTPDKIADEQVLKLVKDYHQATHVSDGTANLTPQQIQGYVDVLKAHPGAYNHLTETLRGQLMVPLAQAGFKDFDAPTQQQVTAATNRRASDLDRLARDKANGVYDQDPQGLAERQARIDANYRIAMGQAGATTAAPFKPTPFDPRAAPAAPPVVAPLADGALPTLPPRPSGGRAAPATPTPAPYGLREDGTPKGDGFLGLLKRKDGGVSSEISISVGIDGKEVEIPTMVPTLSKSEVDWLLSNDIKNPQNIPAPIKDKAIAFARQRIKDGLSPFAGPDESPQAAPAAPAAREPGSQYVIPPPPGPAELLKGMKPSKYTLTDGSRWRVNRDGTIVKLNKDGTIATVQK